jgi:hypothetical protein
VRRWKHRKLLLTNLGNAVEAVCGPPATALSTSCCCRKGRRCSPQPGWRAPPPRRTGRAGGTSCGSGRSTDGAGPAAPAGRACTGTPATSRRTTSTGRSSSSAGWPALRPGQRAGPPTGLRVRRRRAEPVQHARGGRPRGPPGSVRGRPGGAPAPAAHGSADLIGASDPGSRLHRIGAPVGVPPRSLLHAGGGDALDDEPLREGVDDQNRNRGDHRARHQQVVADAVGALQG